MDRRAFLAAAASAATSAGLAGCLGIGAGGPGGSGTDGDDGDGGSDRGNREPTTFEKHPATGAVDAQPYLGPEPGTATGTIVAFEDPSCPRCAAFERETVPRIRGELVEPGDATFVFRGYPVVYEWGEPAVHALEAAFARDEGAHWALADHYFAEQDAFDAGNVLDRTRAFLADETDLDAAAVVENVRTEAHGDRVGTDLDAGEAAGAGNTTPTVYLFRDGEYRTVARGSVSFEAVRNALGL